MIKRIIRTIDVWIQAPICVEREGDTLSIQVVFGNGEKAAMVLPLAAAIALAAILPDATAIRGDVVATTDLVS